MVESILLGSAVILTVLLSGAVTSLGRAVQYSQWNRFDLTTKARERTS